MDLSEDDPATVKRAFMFLYDGDYEPTLPPAPDPLPPVRPVILFDRVNGPFSYDFPHTCKPGGPDCFVCPDHQCEARTCRSMCRNFTCGVCPPDAQRRHQEAPQQPPPDGGPQQLLIHANLIEFADKYQILPLKELAREKFSRAAAQFWDDDCFVAAAQ